MQIITGYIPVIMCTDNIGAIICCRYYAFKLKKKTIKTKQQRMHFSEICTKSIAMNPENMDELT